MPQDPASYRDPSGHVHMRNGRVLRSILPPGQDQYAAITATGFLEREAERGRLVGTREVDLADLAGEAPDAVHVLEHPRLPFISYPYEWSFDGLKAAALLTLDLHLDALADGLTLSDASAYNVQFVGPHPVFIDVLSLMRYEEGQVWFGYRQFCEQFLNPLLLTARTGVAFQPLYRGTLEGITPGDLSALLPLLSKFDPRIALHVALQARLQRTNSAKRTARAKAIRLTKAGLRNNLLAMRSWVATLAPPASQRTPWQQYEQTAQYTIDERGAKAQFVSDAVGAARPAVLWDLGCNAGEYAEIALQAGAATVFGFEPDPGALNAAFRRAVSRQLAFLPLALDLTNPSSSTGWRQQERLGLAERRNAEFVLCLALLHHLVLGRNLPLDQVLDWIVALAPRGVIEFVPLTDPMARQLVALKPRIGADYELDAVRALLGRRAAVTRERVVTSSGRVLLAFERR